MINCGSCKGQHELAAEVRACYGHDGQARPAPAPEQAPEQAPAQPREVPNGTYTIVFDPEVPEEYRTLRLRDDFRDDGPEGAQVVEYLSGPDNELDFTGCAFLEGARLRVWKRHRGGELQREVEECVRVLLGERGDEDPLGDARLAYAIVSGRCSACGRKLTVPASLHRGMGPDCAEKRGLL